VRDEGNLRLSHKLKTARIPTVLLLTASPAIGYKLWRDKGESEERRPDQSVTNMQSNELPTRFEYPGHCAGTNFQAQNSRPSCLLYCH